MELLAWIALIVPFVAVYQLLCSRQADKDRADAPQGQPDYCDAPTTPPGF